jgi:DNA-binding beta-propeller fold protein YncE
VLADFGNHRIVKLQYRKGTLTEVGEVPIPGRPFGVSLDSENNLYVTDFDSSRIYVFSPNDSLIYSFGIPGRAYGEIHQPTGIAVIDARGGDNLHRDDYIAVVDNYGTRVSKFTRQGRFLGSVQTFDLGLADAHFMYIAMDAYGSMYVTDEVNNQIHKFDHNLNYVISVGRTGTGQGEFISPRGITIWRRYGQVFVSEKQGGQYLWLAVDGFVVGCFPSAFSPGKPGTTLAIYLTDEARVYISVQNGKGEKIRELIEGIKRVPGEYLVVWDGYDGNNNLVAPGEYIFNIRLRGLQGHGRRIDKILKAGVKCIAS